MAYIALGKFSSARDELLYILACDWDWAQDHDGDTEGFGAYAWRMTLDREIDALSDWNLAMIAEECERLDSEDATLADSIYGHWVISTDSQGFVRVEQMPDEEQLEALWTAFKDSYERWAEGQEDE